MYLTINRAERSRHGRRAPPSAHLLVRIHVYVTLDALLAHIGPAVARHPFALALGTLVLAEAPLLALVRRQALALWSCLRKIIRICQNSMS